MEYPEYPYPELKYALDFIYKVYGWMSLALAVTAGVAYYIFKNPYTHQAVLSNKWLLVAMIFLQLTLVVILSAFIMRLGLGLAILLFILYAISVGVTLSVIFSIYTTASIYSTFLVVAGMFGASSLYGYFTKSDLTSLGSFSLMALIGIILGIFVNILLKSSIIDFVLSLIGVSVFVFLTAFDVQKMKGLGQQLMIYSQTRKKVAILGALTLYLDLINMFLFMLRFIGKRREG